MELVRGGRSFSGSIEGYIDLDVLSFDDMLDIINSEMCAVRIRPEGTGSTLDQYLFDALVSSESLEFSTEDAGSVSFDFDGSGQINATPQA
jgi:hypothetical protein